MEVRLNTKWIATVASIWIQCCVAGTYTFSIYSSTLKSTQNYDQSTLELVAVFKDIGGSAGVLSGLLFSYVTLNNHRRTRFLRGPWVVHLTGAILCFTGYFLIWASVVGLIHRPVPVPLMCLFIFIAAHSQTFFNTGNIVTGLMNFGNYSGTIVGIMKGFLGLSGAVLIQVYNTICKGNPSAFLLILALFPTLVSLLLMFHVRIYGTDSVHDKKHLNAFSAVAVTVAVYFMVITIMESILTFPLWAHIITLIILLLLLVSPLRIAIVANMEEEEEEEEDAMVSPAFSTEPDPVAYQELPDDESQVKAAFDDKVMKDEEDVNLLHAMCTVNFWLLCIATLCGMGSGIATMNNIGQVGDSLGYTTTEINSLVSLWSIWNFFGRFGAGYVSDVFLHKIGLARPIFMVITLVTMSIGHIVIAVGFPGNLFVGTIIVGVCYGSQWSLMPTITSEIFGVGHMGTIFNTIAIACPVGSYLCSVRIIGYIYDKVASSEDHSCYGTGCFMSSFLIMASVAIFGSLVSFMLFSRTRRFYNQVVLTRLRHCSRT